MVEKDAARGCRMGKQPSVQSVAHGREHKKFKPPPEFEDLRTQEGYETALEYKGYVPRSATEKCSCWQRLNYRPLEGPPIKAADIWKRVQVVLLILEEASYRFEDQQVREAWSKEERSFWNKIGK